MRKIIDEENKGLEPLAGDNLTSREKREKAMEYYLLTAILIDLIIGDPLLITHPVIIIGRLITLIESGLRKIVRTGRGERLAGVVLVILVVGAVYLTTFYLIKLAFSVNYYLGIIINLWLLSTTIAITGLARAGMKVYENLSAGDIESARESVGEIVGRDTGQMEEGEVVRATVETIAENTSDGILAPIFFYIIGGTPLAMAYKAINTLDSMVGHLNKKYKYFGWAAARLDDLANFIPARLTGFGFALAALLLGHNAKRSWQVMWRDAGKHPSVNAGFPEAAVAGALGIRLGGLNYYQGRAEFRNYLGDKERELIREDIKAVIRMMFWNLGLFIFFFLIVRVIISLVS